MGGAGLPSPGRIATNRDETGTVEHHSVPNCPHFDLSELPQTVTLWLSDLHQYVHPHIPGHIGTYGAWQLSGIAPVCPVLVCPTFTRFVPWATYPHKPGHFATRHITTYQDKAERGVARHIGTKWTPTCHDMSDISVTDTPDRVASDTPSDLRLCNLGCPKSSARAHSGPASPAARQAVGVDAGASVPGTAIPGGRQPGRHSPRIPRGEDGHQV